MKKFAAAIALILMGFYGRSQKTADIGIQLSGAGYWGDIENVDYSKSITPVVGALGRWNFNKRMSIRGQLTTGNLKAIGTFSDAYIASPTDTRNTTGLYEPDTTFSFNFRRSIQSVEALFEFNFWNYKMGSLNKENFTPFVSIGVGGFYSRAPRIGTFILDPVTASFNPLTPAAPYLDTEGKQTNRTDALTLIVPVGVGLKFNITKNLGGVIEVIVRKTFADNIDNLDDPKRFQNPEDNQTGYPDRFASNPLSDKDWYATCTASLLYRLWTSKGNCKIYDKNK